MKILHVIADLDRRRGGPAQVCVEMAVLMAGEGHTVQIITTDRGFAAEYQPLTGSRANGGSIVIETHPLNFPQFWATSWAMRRRLVTAIQEADVIHIHMLYLFHDWVTEKYCRKFAKPYIVQPHGSLDPFIYRRHRWRKSIVEAWFQNALQRHARGLLYTQREEMDLAQPHAQNPRGWVVPIGIDLSSFDDLPPREASRARFPGIGDRKMVLFFGRLNFKKGVDTTIKMFAEVARERDDIVLVLAGPDDGMGSVAEKMVSAAGLSERIIFTGMVTGQDKRIVLGGGDVFVLPSYSENFGVAVIEAAFCKIPVIISDRVNLWPDFRDARAGLVAPPTVEAFAAQLRYVLDHPDEAAEMAARGADLVRRKFTWNALAPLYKDVYSDAFNY